MAKESQEGRTLPEASRVSPSTPSLSCNAPGKPRPLGLSFPCFLRHAALVPCSRWQRLQYGFWGCPRLLTPSTRPICSPGVRGGLRRPLEGQSASKTLDRGRWARTQLRLAPSSSYSRKSLSSSACCVTPGSILTLSGPTWSRATNLQWATWVSSQAIPCLSFPLYARRSWSPSLRWWEGHLYSTVLSITPDPRCDQGIPRGCSKDSCDWLRPPVTSDAPEAPSPQEARGGARATGEDLG